MKIRKRRAPRHQAAEPATCIVDGCTRRASIPSKICARRLERALVPRMCSDHWCRLPYEPRAVIWRAQEARDDAAELAGWKAAATLALELERNVTIGG